MLSKEHINIDASFLEKSITNAKLKEILSKLKDDCILYPNQVGNLSVVHDGLFVGYIDISSETFESAIDG